tara:strand:+ start:78 stop:353 length:276 start_codon:yes stop_codon:yes gene_type:complete
MQLLVLGVQQTDLVPPHYFVGLPTVSYNYMSLCPYYCALQQEFKKMPPTAYRREVAYLYFSWVTSSLGVKKQFRKGYLDAATGRSLHLKAT